MRKHKKQKPTKLILISLGLAIVLGLIVYAAWPSSKPTAPAPSAVKTSPAPTAAAQFDKTQFRLDVASSLWAVVNKGRQLPGDYVPANLVAPSVPLRLSAADSEMRLRAEAAAALQTMFQAAKAQGLNLMLESGYRSYAEQVTVYNRYVSQSGVAQADTFSARPGHSEHQTGLAADIEPTSRRCEVDQCFGELPEGKWLAANSYKYGFIIRYRPGTENLTGYEAEPWHVRYLGKALAAQVYQSGLTLEQYFGLPSYTTYPAQSLSLKE